MSAKINGLCEGSLPLAPLSSVLLHSQNNLQVTHTKSQTSEPVHKLTLTWSAASYGMPSVTPNTIASSVLLQYCSNYREISTNKCTNTNSNYREILTNKCTNTNPTLPPHMTVDSAHHPHPPIPPNIKKNKKWQSEMSITSPP